MTAPHETMQGPNIHILSANVAMPPHLSVFGAPEQYQEWGRITGVDGFEINPIQSRYMYRATKHAVALRENGGEVSAYNERYIDEFNALRSTLVTVHEPFRDEKISENLIGSPAGYLSPHTERGQAKMRMLQYLAGHPLHAIFYARFMGGARFLDAEDLPFSERSVQPKPYDWKLWGLSETASIEEIEQAKEKYGFTSFTADGFHLQDKDLGVSFKDPVSLMCRMSFQGLFTAKHVSVNRQDCSEPGSELAESTAAANEAFLDSPEKAAATPEGMMLQIAAHDWKTLPEHAGQDRYVVFERPPMGILRLLTPGEIQREQDEQAVIVEVIRQLIDAA